MDYLKVTSSSDEVGSDRVSLSGHIREDDISLRIATVSSRSFLVAPILTATATIFPSASSFRELSHYPRLTSLHDLVTSLSDNVETDDLLFWTGTDQLVLGWLLVLFVKHGE